MPSKTSKRIVLITEISLNRFTPTSNAVRGGTLTTDFLFSCGRGTHVVAIMREQEKERGRVKKKFCFFLFL